MNKIIRKITAFAAVLAILLLSAAVPCRTVFAADGDPVPVETWLDEISDALCRENGAKTLQKLLDGAFSKNPAGGSEWYVMAFRDRIPGLYYGNYRSALEKYVKDNEIKSETTRLRLALALKSIESEIEFDPGIYGLSEQSGIMSYVFCLHLANNGVKMNISEEELINSIIELRHDDGGWSVLGGEGDSDVTAMTVQALAPHTDDERVFSAVSDGIAFLSESQKEDGGYYSMGAMNCESCCQVLMALCSCGIDAAKDSRFIKNGNTIFDAIRGFEASSGRYCHVKGDGGNTACTTQVYLAFSCYDIFLKGNEHFYVFGPFAEGAKPSSVSVKTWLYIGTAVLLAVYCAVMFLRGKRKAKGYLFALCAALAVYAAITFVNVSSPDKYYKGTAGGNVETYITINCSSVAGEKDFIPQDGYFLKDAKVMIAEGASAKDQLVLAAKENTLQLEFDGTGYVSGMGNLYEFDFGELSGWVFRVNGETPGRGSYDVALEPGDRVEWIYSLELGKDID